MHCGLGYIVARLALSGSVACGDDSSWNVAVAVRWGLGEHRLQGLQH